MARYWVGGTGTWNATNTANWSATSGGAAGASVPTAPFEVVYFDANSGSGTVTVSGAPSIPYLFVEKSDITLLFNSSLTSTDNVTLTSGTIDLNSQTLTTAQFVSTNTNARTLAFGATGSIIITGGNGINAWACNNATNFTITGSANVYGTYSGAGPGSRNFFHASSGGANEANAPNFFVTAGTDPVDFYAAKNLDFTGFSGTLNTSSKLIYGSLTLSPTMTLSSTTNTFQFASTNATPRTITSNGKTFDCPVLFSGVAGKWQLTDAFSVAAARTLTLTHGTLDAAGQNVSIGSFALGGGTKTITLGSGTWTVAGNWNANTNNSNFVVTASTGTISMTSASTKTFSGGGKTWPTLNQGGAGTLIIAQSNTFTNITDTVQPSTVTLTAGTTQTVSNFTLSGTAGNLVTLNSSTPGTQATLSCAADSINVSYLNIQDSFVTGGADWTALASTDSGNNTGWFFNPSTLTNNETPFALRSFTERRTF